LRKMDMYGDPWGDKDDFIIFHIYTYRYLYPQFRE